jgi:hypothetical protein
MSELFDQVMALCVEVGDCLEWQGPMGVGKNSACPIFRKYDGQRTKNYQVARLVWEGRNGPIPEGRIVYRHCCNDRCVGCLRLGKPGDAMRHRGRRGVMRGSGPRIAASTAASRARKATICTEEIADQVRILLAEGMTSAQAASATGMTVNIVKNIRRGTCWHRSSQGASIFNWRPA